MNKILITLMFIILSSCGTKEIKTGWTKDEVIEKVFDGEVCGQDKDCD